MNFRIAVCGSSGTGKTSVIKKVIEKINLPINPIGSRSVALRMGYDNPYDVDKFGRREEFQHLLMADKVDWESKEDNFITDRSTFDVLSYSTIHDVNAVNQNFLESAIRGIERYTHIFFCPLAEFFNLGDDPVRVKSKTYHEMYEALMMGSFNKFKTDKFPEIVNITGTILEDRTNQVLKIIL